MRHRPIFAHQSRFWLFVIADDINHPIEMHKGDDKTFQHLKAVVYLTHPMLAATQQNLAPMIKEGAQNLFHTANFWGYPVNQHIHIQRKPHLEIRVAKHHPHQHFGIDIFTPRDKHHANVFSTLVANIVKDRHFLGLDQLGNFFDQLRFLHLIGDLSDHNLPLSAPQILNLPKTAQPETTAPGAVSLRHALSTFHNHSACGKVRTLHKIQ